MKKSIPMGTDICPECGAEVEVRRYYDSREYWYCRKRDGGCGGVGRRSEGGMWSNTALRRGTCSDCGEETTARGSRPPQRCSFCHPMRGKNATPLFIRSCPRCQSLFVTKKSNKEYCTDTCGRDAGLARRQRKAKTGRGAFKVAPNARTRIAFEEGYRCHLCGDLIDLSVKAPHPDSLTLDHLIPRSRGGSDDRSNLRAAHHSCNSRRGASPL